LYAILFIMPQLPDIKDFRPNIHTISNAFINSKKVSLSILRLDTIHPHISGNKFFKLYYFLQRAITEQKKMVTFGGAYSNHLYATAAACKEYGIPCAGIVRGERPRTLSPTLLFCQEMGMELKFISREDYSKKDNIDLSRGLLEDPGEYILVPEGGYSEEGIRGAALIGQLYPASFDHICCATATATTLAGLIRSALPAQQINGFSVLRDESIKKRLEELYSTSPGKNYTLNDDYHFGGYAKKTPALLSFMNNLFNEFTIPTDFVYTAKMMYGVFVLAEEGCFRPGTRIVVLVTG